MAVKDIIDNFLKNNFRKFGIFLANRKLYFIIFPILLCAVLSVGCVRAKYSTDIDQLFLPVDGEGWTEMAVAKEYFPTNFSHFDATRSIDFGMYGYVMVTPTKEQEKINQYLIL